MHVELAVEGTLQRLSDTPGQVNIGRRDHQALVFLFDADDAVERMLTVLRFFLISRQPDEFVLVLSEECTIQGDDACREPIVDAMACRAKILVRVSRSVPPLPSAVMVDHAA